MKIFLFILYLLFSIILSATEFENEDVMLAIFNDDVEILSKRLEEGLNPNYEWKNDGGSLLNLAVQHKARKCVKLLIEKGADKKWKDHNGRDLIYWANFIEDKEIIELLK